ncbi:MULTISPECIES: heavy metal sensor histidine kinase [Burkholderia cepacia complex]|jgi:two-component system, OmpR family, heavy metal sensor histidine kinase CusS|uniref:Sensor protein n=1 Tax=Burkholderia cenocepacia TaxID=95486 RepID=A0ABD4UFK5_9BURK|nr:MULTISPECIES: heavy metal sensor histidine kinase [Burkholderia cepacia complex]MCW3696644.1 heavy metal sensor histidine kinase [Burkholderia cenocepacia]MCW3704860.1 heavy metal sensor histidine kinase [Burkholderia cenocepacia]MCW3713120.1 heavy metal sensor histidine kinase [Burkholderia cenocepacia]MCW3725225.1 heavy metal sensor histidine kinase [Burkholderia cenocepacia]MCW3729112.1 heavy metal sensor histidine kinase [Burkholderia cenocepacia]
MTRAGKYSLLKRLTAAFALVTALIFLILGAYLYHALSSQLRQRDDIEIAGKLDQVTKFAQESGSPDGIRDNSLSFHETLLSHSGLFVGIFDANGNPLIQHSDLTSISLSSKLIDGQQPNRAFECHPPGIDFAECIYGTGSLRSTTVTIIVARSADDRRSLLRYYKIDAFIASVIGAILVTISGYVITRRGLHPIKQIGHQASTIEAHRLSDRLSIDRGPIELAEISSSINRMLDRLERAFARLSQFSSDLSHDMRTPLANIISSSQIILSRPRRSEEYEALIESNIEECERLQRMIENMLFLARTDNATQHINLNKIKTEDELPRIISYFQHTADEKSVVIKNSGSAIILADTILFRRAIGNILSNAVEHASPHTVIFIRSYETSATASICIENLGNEIPPEHINFVFERFYRVDHARHGSAKNAGLGLAIVKSIMNIHGGDVSVTSQNGKTSFTLSFKKLRE